MHSILLIDDDLHYRETAALVLATEGFLTFEADCPDSAFPILFEESISLILCDLHMPFTRGPSQDEFVTSVEVGARTALELRWALPDVGLAVLTALPQSITPNLRDTLYPIPVFTKPARPAALVSLVSQLLLPRIYRSAEATLDC